MAIDTRFLCLIILLTWQIFLTIFTAIDAPGGFLFEWWSVFWDIFIARTNDKHSDVAASYIEVGIKYFTLSCLIGRLSLGMCRSYPEVMPLYFLQHTLYNNLREYAFWLAIHLETWECFVSS